MKVLVICARKYNGHELWTTLGVLQERGHSFEVVSTDLIIKDEKTFQSNVVERRVYDIDPSKVQTFDGLIVVSGNMADTEAYWDDKHVQSLVGEMRQLSRPVAAICCSVPTLAPICAGVKVSFFPLIRSRKRMLAVGAIPTNVALTVDQGIATAEHQMASMMWAHEIANLLENKPPQFSFVDSGYTPKGRPRRMPKEVEAMIEAAKRAND